MFSKIKLNISCLLYPSSTLTVNSNLKSSSQKIGSFFTGVSCFSTNKGGYSAYNGMNYNILPSINGKTVFVKDMVNFLGSLDESLIYKLDYAIYYHCNDIDTDLKLLKNYPVFDEELSSNIYRGDIMRSFLSQAWFESTYKYKGYLNVHSELFSSGSFMNKSDLTNYVKNLRETLGGYVIDCNEEGARDGFFEFKKSTLVTISAVSNSLSDTSSYKAANVNNTGNINSTGVYKGMRVLTPGVCNVYSSSYIKGCVLGYRSSTLGSVRVGMGMGNYLNPSSYSCSKFKKLLSESRGGFNCFYSLKQIYFYHTDADRLSLSKHSVDLDRLYSHMNNINYRLGSDSGVDNFVNMLKIYLQEKTRLSSVDVDKVCAAFSGLFECINLYNDCILIYNEHFNISALDEEVRERMLRQYREVINCLKFIGFYDPSLILHSLLSGDSKLDSSSTVGCSIGIEKLINWCELCGISSSKIEGNVKMSEGFVELVGIGLIGMKLRSLGLSVCVDKRFDVFKEKYIDSILSDSPGWLDISLTSSKNKSAKKDFYYLKSLALNFEFVDLFYGYLYDILDVFEMYYGLFSKVSMDDINSIRIDDINGIRMDSEGGVLSGKPSSVFHIYNDRRLDWYMNYCSSILSSRGEKVYYRTHSEIFAKNKILLCLKDVLDSTHLTLYEKQFCCEIFLIYFESNYVKWLVHESTLSGDVLKVDKITSSILVTSYHRYNKRLNALLRHPKNNIRGILEIISKDNSVDNLSRKQLALLILNLFKVEDLSGRVYSYITGHIGKEVSVNETSLVMGLVNSLVDLLKDCSLKDLKHLNDDLKDIFDCYKTEILYLSVEDEVELGQMLVDLFLECYSTVFVRYTVLQNVGKTVKKMKCVKLNGLYADELYNNIFNPSVIPMVSPSICWGKDKRGGFISDLYTTLIKRNTLVRRNVSSKFSSELDSYQYESINYLNKVKFSINKAMLDFLVKEWKSDRSVIFKNFNKPYSHLVSSDEYEQTNKSIIVEHDSKYWLYLSILNLASLYDDKSFYLPCFMDFRGRIYPMVNYLSYQSTDIARSLFLFDSGWDGDDVSIEYIYIYLANSFGMNRLSRKSRVSWCEKNINKLIDLYENNWDGFVDNYLSKAKEGAQFMSSFLAVWSYLRELEGSNGCVSYYSRLPILFDATCSGMQHLSGLTVDLQLATYVNIISNDKPEDFYLWCAQAVEKAIENYQGDDIVKSVLGKIKLDRSIVKKSVMTIPYNIKLEGMSHQITDHFTKYFIDLIKPLPVYSSEDDGILGEEERIDRKKVKGYKETNKKLYFNVPAEYTKDNQMVTISGRDAGILCNLIYKTILEHIKPINQLRKYISDIIKVLRLLKKPIYWISPSGMKIWGCDVKMISKPIKTSLLKKSKPITVSIPTDQYDYVGIERSLMANFIHSLDASNIHILVRLIKSNGRGEKVKNLYTVHDCFASSASEMAIVDSLVREAFASIYFKQNYLKKFDTIIQSQILEDERISVEGDKIRYQDLDADPDTMVVLDRPLLPNYNWESSKEIFLSEIIKSQHFIS